MTTTHALQLIEQGVSDPSLHQKVKQIVADRDRLLALLMEVHKRDSEAVSALKAALNDYQPSPWLASFFERAKKAIEDVESHA